MNAALVFQLTTLVELSLVALPSGTQCPRTMLIVGLLLNDALMSSLLLGSGETLFSSYSKKSLKVIKVATTQFQVSMI